MILSSDLGEIDQMLYIHASHLVLWVGNTQHMPTESRDVRTCSNSNELERTEQNLCSFGNEHSVFGRELFELFWDVSFVAEQAHR